MGITKKKALVGESNYTEFEILNDFLTNRGFDVHWVKSGHDAVSQFESVQPDLVILDALLPGLSGLRVCQQIRNMSGGDKPKTILLSTVYKQFKQQYDSRKTVGVDAYSGKPIEIASLDRLVTTLLGTQITQVETAPDDEGQDKKKPASSVEEIVEPSRVGLSGDLSYIPFPKVLYFLNKHNRTGALEVNRKSINKVIYVESGRLIFVTSNLSKESLGRYLVQNGTITTEEYNRSLEQMLSTGHQQGQTLLDMGVVTPHQLYEGLHGHLVEKVLSIFSWESGTYQFKAGSPQIDRAMAVEIDLMDVIYQGIKRFYPLARLETYFNDYKNQRLLPLKKSVYTQGEVHLQPTEAQFFNSIKTDLSFGQIVVRSKMTLTQTFQLVYFLLLIEAVRFEGDYNLGERSISRQKDKIERRREKRERIRQSSFERSVSTSERIYHYQNDIADAFEKIDKLNYFQMFNIDFKFKYEKLKAAYHYLAQKYHPVELYSIVDDITKAKADSIFRTITEGYEILLDQSKRDEYIRLIKAKPVEAKPVIEPEEVATPTPPEVPTPEYESESFDFDSMPDMELDDEPLPIEETGQQATIEMDELKPETDEAVLSSSEHELDLGPELRVDTESKFGFETEGESGFEEEYAADIDSDFDEDRPQGTDLEALIDAEPGFVEEPEPVIADEQKEEIAPNLFEEDVLQAESGNNDFSIDLEFGDELDSADQAGIGNNFQWEESEAFSESESDFAQIDAQKDSFMDISEGKSITRDMASILKSELEFQKGEDALNDKDFALAVQQFQKAMDLNPDEMEYKAFWSWAVYSSNPADFENSGKAKEGLSEALSINPNLDIAHYFLGCIAKDEDRPEMARNHFEQALQYNPDNEKAISALKNLENE